MSIFTCPIRVLRAEIRLFIACHLLQPLMERVDMGAGTECG
jgi:hypothetical protein